MWLHQTSRLVTFLLFLDPSTSEAGLRKECLALFGRIAERLHLKAPHPAYICINTPDSRYNRNAPLLDLVNNPAIERPNFRTNEPTSAGALPVGLRNPTSIFSGLQSIGGRRIEDLEVTMRPATMTNSSRKDTSASTSGFIGENESLRGVLRDDNALVVDQLGLSHQDLAEPLYYIKEIMNIGIQEAMEVERQTKDTGRALQGPYEIVYRGQRYQIVRVGWAGGQISPLGGGGAVEDYIVRNLDNERVISFSQMTPELIGRYGFYEGKGTEFRVDPRDIIEVFPHLRRPGMVIPESESNISELSILLSTPAGHPRQDNMPHRYGFHFNINVGNRLRRLSRAELETLAPRIESLLSSKSWGALSGNYIDLVDIYADRALELNQQTALRLLRPLLIRFRNDYARITDRARRDYALGKLDGILGKLP